VFVSHSCPVYALSFITQNLLRVNTQISLPSPHNTNNNKRYDPKTETGTLFDSKPLPFGSNKKQREKKKTLLLLSSSSSSSSAPPPSSSPVKKNVSQDPNLFFLCCFCSSSLLLSL